MAKRVALSKKIRFEVFKRDMFTCQYCGAKAPEVVLHVDHIIPVVDGGENELLNLQTACSACNLGKGARQLADDSVLVRQREQLEQLAERREQLQMLKMWRDELKGLDRERVLFVAAEIRERAGIEAEISEEQLTKIESWLSKFTVEEVLDAMEVGAAQYLEHKDGYVYGFGRFFDYIPRIAHNKKHHAGEEDFWHQVNYVRAILRKRGLLARRNEGLAKGEAARLIKAIGFEQAKQIASHVDRYAEWEDEVDQRAPNE